jgi:hypothetical protein
MIDVNNWLGRSQYSDVLLANVAIQEFRIYDFALDSADVAASEAAGPDAPTPPAAGGHLPLPAPVLAATASTDNSITLSWNDLSAASALTLQERVSGTTAWTTVSSTLASSLTSYTATGLSPTTNYDFQLEADNGPWSNTVTAMTEAPPQAVLAAGTITYNSVNLTWNNLAAAAALTLQYRVTGASGWTTVSSSLASTLTNYTVSGLSPTTSYDFQLEANGGAWSNTVTATTSAQPPPIPVLNTPVSYAIGTTEIILTWNISGQYDTVVVQRSTNPVIGFVTIATLPSGATQYIDTGLAPNTSYYYRIYTIYKGANSPFTAAKLIRTAITPPPQPTAPGFIIAAPISDTAISIFWQGANGVVIYQIQRLNGGVWTTIGTTPASASYFTDTTGLPQTFYDYRIESVNAAGVSSPISAISETYAQLDAWRLANFGTTAITTASASVATDFDGVPNLTKFAFNLNVGEQAPTLVAGTGTFGLPATWWDPATGSLFVEFVCRNSALNPGITYTVQFSSDLVNWTDSGTLVQSTAIDTIWQRVRYQDTTPVAAGASHARFARVMVTQTTGN